jgi:hypothetical protein
MLKRKRCQDLRKICENNASAFTEDGKKRRELEQSIKELRKRNTDFSRSVCKFSFNVDGFISKVDRDYMAVRFLFVCDVDIKSKSRTVLDNTETG